MKVSSYEVEVQTLLNRISDNELNLQPSFQRGEVWSQSKKKKLIDTIFRGWRIPPIHILESDLYTEEILDGQQRLAAIRDFYNNLFVFDGNIEPKSPELKSLDGKRFSDLPEKYRRMFLRHTISVNKLSDFKNEEPSELFFRLNQPTSLSPSELRNAYIGVPRNQIKRLVDLFIQRGAGPSTVGFSNTRLAYDDVISRVCATIENGDLNIKVTSKDISDRYRNGTPYSESTIASMERVIKRYFTILSIINSEYNQFNPKLNKATLYTWLLILFKHSLLFTEEFEDDATLFYLFESTRNNISKKNDMNSLSYQHKKIIKNFDIIEKVFARYNKRASLSTNDIKSVIERDFFVELFNYFINSNFTKVSERQKTEIFKLISSNKSFDNYMDSEFNYIMWGSWL